MTTTEAYVVTDLHPPKRDRWLTRGRVGRFFLADLMVLGAALLLLTRVVRWAAQRPVHSATGFFLVIAIKVACFLVLLHFISFAIAGG